jgi:hypothetical protein
MSIDTRQTKTQIERIAAHPVKRAYVDRSHEGHKLDGPTQGLHNRLPSILGRSRKCNQSVALNHHLIAHCAASAEQDAMFLWDQLLDGDGRTHGIAGPNGRPES